MIPEDILNALNMAGYELFNMFDIDYLKDKYLLSKINNPKVYCRFEIFHSSSSPLYDDEYRSILIQKIKEAVKALDEYLEGENDGIIQTS